MFTNRSRRFHSINLIETGLSDFYRVIVSVFRAFVKRLPAKVIEYRNYKTFDQNEVLQKHDRKLIRSNSQNNE